MTMFNTSSSSQPPAAGGGERAFYCSSASSAPATTPGGTGGVIVTPGGGHEPQPELPDQTPPDPGVVCYQESSYLDHGGGGFQAQHIPNFYGDFTPPLPFNLFFSSEFGFPGMFQSPTLDVPGSSGQPFLQQLGNRLNPIGGQPSGASSSGQFLAPPPPPNPHTHPHLVQGYQPRLPTEILAAAVQPPMPKRVGGRRPKEFDMPSALENDDDHDKRMKRRLRNKEAAARCRQRRLDLMQNLQAEVDRWKNENQIKDSVIQELRRQKESLEAFLRTHDCKLPEEARMNLSSITDNSGGGNYQQNLRSMPQMDFLKDHNAPHQNGMGTRKRQNPSAPLNQQDLNTNVPMKQPKMEPEPTLASLNTEEVTRPETLGISGSGLNSMPNVTTSGGLPLATPSNGLSSYTPQTGGDLFQRSFPSLTGGDWSSGGGLLQQETGLTPCASNPMNFTAVTTSATPLQQNNDITSL